jgi:hypothetical protein
MLEDVYTCGNLQRIFKKMFMSEICFVTSIKSVEVPTNLFKERNFLKVLNFKNLECSGQKHFSFKNTQGHFREV